MPTKPALSGAALAGQTGAMLPSKYEYKVNSTTGKLQLWKKADGAKPAKMVSEQDQRGTWLSTAVTTGVGSFHLGDTISMGSGGEYLATNFKQIGFPTSTDQPVVQNVTNDGTVIGNPEYLFYGTTLDTSESNGVMQGGSVDYIAPFTPAANRCFFALQTVCAEAFVGDLTYKVVYTNGGQELARFDFAVNVTPGATLVIPFDYPLWALGSEGLTTSLVKTETGVPFKVRNGTTIPTQPYRLSKSRTWETRALIQRSFNINNTTAFPDSYWDSTIYTNVGGGGYMMTPPTAIGAGGRRMTFVKTDNGAGPVVVQGFGGQRIGATTQFLLSSQYDSVTVESDGANLFVVASVIDSGGFKTSFYASDATWTRDTRTQSMRVRLQGAGSAGQPCYMQAGYGRVHTGGGGASGGYVEASFTKAQLPNSVSIGNLRPLSQSYLGPGGYQAGGTCSFGGYLYTGNANCAAYNTGYDTSYTQIFAGGTPYDVVGSSGCTVIVYVPGGAGEAGFGQWGNFVGGGSGANSVLGHGARCSAAIATGYDKGSWTAPSGVGGGCVNVYTNGSGYGFGGAGRSGTGGGSGWAYGSVGGPGCCIVEEYF